MRTEKQAMDATRQVEAFDREIEAARLVEAAGQIQQAWRCLEPAHVVGQGRMPLHWRSHRAMLGLARRTGKGPEVAARLLRHCTLSQSSLCTGLTAFLLAVVQERLDCRAVIRPAFGSALLDHHA